MKKNILLASLVLAILSGNAQEPADALRTSWYVPGATARIKAIGGAMGSLGGDVTATFVNPAGLAFYRTGDFVFTPQFGFGKTAATYLGREENQKNSRFNFGTTGFVWGGETNKKEKKGAAISLAYNRAADYNSRFVYRGLNNKSSYSQRFLEEIGNTRDANVVASNFPNGTSLAFNTFWIDTVGGSTNGNFQFKSRAAALLSTGLIQQDSVATWGGLHEFALGMGFQLNEKLMIGGTVGVPYMDYHRHSAFTEADATENANNKFDFANYTEDFKMRGAGFNLKAGLIYKPQEYWRIGFAVHSPTIFSLTDTYDYSVTTNTESYEGTQTQSTADITGTDIAQYKYWLITPYRMMASISYVLREIQDVTRQRGFITADVEYVNHAATSYTTHDEVNNSAEDEAYLDALNGAIDKAYKSAFNFRVGGELKFTTIMVRLGAAYYGNPYRVINGEENGDRLNLSGGLGYRNKGFFVDLTYVHARNRDTHFAYRLENGAYSGADIKNRAGNVLATVGFKF